MCVIPWTVVFCIITLCDSRVFVSQNGSDTAGCGVSSQYSCGTLRHASTLLNINETEIYIIGQNINSINNTNSTYHPCLPQPINFYENNHVSITISFDENNIEIMSDWYPQICIDYDIKHYNKSNYANKYMFEAVNFILTINNLYIDFNQFGEYKIQRGIIGVNSLWCNRCKFENIYNENDDVFMIDVTSSITFYSSIFTNIKSVNTFISGYSSMTIDNTNVTNCTFEDTFITIQYNSFTDQTAEDIQVHFINSLFMNIHSQTAVVEDLSVSGSLTIENVDFINIEYGGVYTAIYRFGSTVNITNAKISTNQIAETNQRNLLYFHYADTVHIENVEVNYYYDINTNCEFESASDNRNNVLHASYVTMKCENPISLITNPASIITINNMNISINIAESDIESFRNQVPSSYDYILMEYAVTPNQLYYNSIISNFAELNITNVVLHGLPFADTFIQNYNLLNVNKMKIIYDEYYSQYNPNALQSQFLIAQVGTKAITNIWNSNLIGAVYQLFIQSGSANIQDSVFHKASSAVVAHSGMNIAISRCTFYSIGRYWSRITLTIQNQKMAIIILENVENVLFEYNQLTGFESFGPWQPPRSVFFDAEGNTKLILRNNVFMVDSWDSYYYDPEIYFHITGLLFMIDNTEISIYENNFFDDDIFEDTPWLAFAINSNTCLSANNFTNFAIRTLYTNITSCFRKSLYKCIDNPCINGQYGNIETKFNEKTSHFNVDMDAAEWLYIYSLFKPWSDNIEFIAMDNIQINVLASNGTPIENGNWRLELYSINLLIMDSIFSTPVSVIYDSNCSVIDNYRLINDETQIAKLKILCTRTINNNYYPSNWSQLVDTISYQNHLSATQMHFIANSSTYYPGQKLKFDYKLFDKLDQEIHVKNYSFESDDQDSQFVINLENNLFLLDQTIDVNEHGFCKVCVSGIIILGVALNHSHIHTLSIQTSLINNNLVLQNDILEIQITSCPIGYGADDNDYQCHICPENTYNLSPNNTQECKPCNEEKNEGVKCDGGEVYVKRNYWLGLPNNKMITSRCPSLYCCNEEIFCNYQDNSTLCADGRDFKVELCGACLQGYSEAMNSPNCIICEESGHSHLWQVKPIILAILYTLYLVSCNPNRNEDKYKAIKIHGVDLMVRPLSKEQSSDPKCYCCFLYSHNKEYFLMLCKTLVLRVILYYMQALGIVLWPSVLSPFMSYVYSITSLFNLETSLPNTDYTQQCAIEGLTSKWKIILALLPWMIIFVLIMIIFPSHYIIKKCSENESNNCCSKNCSKRICSINYGQAILAFVVICVGQILAVCFKLINCQQVGEIKVHFYFGEEICFETWTMAVGITIIIFIVIIFSIMLIMLWRDSPEKRETKNYPLNQLCKYYKPECYFWEHLLFVRRFMISLYGILYTWNWFPIILIAMLLIFLGVHHKYQPFRIKETNVAEYVSLCCLIVVITIQITMTHVDSIVKSASIIISLFIIIPILAVIIYVIKILRQIQKKNHPLNTIASESNQPEKIQSLKEWCVTEGKIGSKASKSTTTEEKTIELAKMQSDKQSELQFGKMTGSSTVLTNGNVLTPMEKVEYQLSQSESNCDTDDEIDDVKDTDDEIDDVKTALKKKQSTHL
eukprot:513988_1